MKQITKRLTYANVMSSIAVFLVLGGATALAAGLAKNSVGSKQLKKNAVTSAKIKNNAVTTAKIKNGAITGAKVNVGTLATVPNASHAGTADSAGSAGNANTVGGQSVVKVFRTLTAGQSNVQVASVAGFNFIATCESSDASLQVTGPVGPAFAMEAGGVAGNLTDQTTDSYESVEPGESGDIEVDELSGGGDATYGTASFYGATAAGTVVSGDLGYDYDTFGDEPENVCLFTGHLIVG
ncbi:MAG TPA: hypothetical protein VLK37_04555 [Solirubrobacterales bacterium]|nr:hypothetical protein [Solirubrobacterales bacterium]